MYHDAFLASGKGMLDFEPDMKRINPDIFIVNYDGHTQIKRICAGSWVSSMLFLTGSRNRDCLPDQVPVPRGI